MVKVKRIIVSLLMLSGLIALGAMPAINCNIGKGANCTVFCGD